MPIQKMEPSLLSNKVCRSGTSKYNERSEGRALGHEFTGTGALDPN